MSLWATVFISHDCRGANLILYPLCLSFEDVAKRICSVIEKMTGIEPEMDSTMDEIGLASVGIPVIVGMINSAFSTKANPLSITSADVVACKTIGDVGECGTTNYSTKKKRR